MKVLAAALILLVTAVLSSFGIVHAEPDSGWAPPVDISESSERSLDSKLLIDDFGHLYILYVRNTAYSENQLYLRVMGVDGQWMPSASAPFTQTTDYNDAGKMVFDAEVAFDGVVHVLSEGRYYASRTKAGVWSDPIDLLAYLPEISSFTDLVVAPDGRILVFATERLLSKDDAETWTDIRVPAGNTGCGHQVDANSIVHMLCLSPENRLAYFHSTADGNWTEPFPLSREDHNLGGSEFIIGKDGRVHVIWYEGGGAGSTGWHYNRLVDGRWSFSTWLPFLQDSRQLDLVRGNANGDLELMFITSGVVHYGVLSPKLKWVEDTLPYAINATNQRWATFRPLVSVEGDVHLLWCQAVCSQSLSDYLRLDHLWRSARGIWTGPTGMEVKAGPRGDISAVAGRNHTLSVSWPSDIQVMFSAYAPPNAAIYSQMTYLPTIRK